MCGETSCGLVDRALAARSHAESWDRSRLFWAYAARSHDSNNRKFSFCFTLPRLVVMYLFVFPRDGVSRRFRQQVSSFDRK